MVTSPVPSDSWVEHESAESRDELKRAAAVHAAEWIEDGMVLGLGTGSTIRYLLEHIAEQRAEGEWPRIVAVSTSEATTEIATKLGIPLRLLAQCPILDLTIDGADEVDDNLSLIKGLGGALLREKVVASVSRRLLIVADDGKRVDRLGTTAPLPVEVDPFAEPVLEGFFRSLGGEPRLRCGAAGEPTVTDGGHHIVDVHFAGGIASPRALNEQLKLRPGVIETGLFIDMATVAVIAAPSGLTLLRRTETGIASGDE